MFSTHCPLVLPRHWWCPAACLSLSTPPRITTLLPTHSAEIKIHVPRMAIRVVDSAIQVHGGAGVSQDTPLAKLYAGLRTLRLADGPDAVHLRTLARLEINAGGRPMARL